MDSIILNSRAVMLVHGPSELKQSKNCEQPTNYWRSNNIRIIQHLTGALLLLIIINIGLVSWIIQSTQLLHDPLGRSSIPNTIRVEGRLVSDQILQTDQIIAPNNNVREPRLGPFLTITSNQSINLQSSFNQTDTNSILLSSNGIEFRVQNSFEIKTMNSRGKGSLKISNSKISVEDSTLHSFQPESGGLRVGESLETNELYGAHNQNLRVESRTESMKATGKESIAVQSPAGSVSVRAPKDVTVNSEEISLNSADVRITHIRQGRTNDALISSHNSDEPIAYQLCLCATNNRVFLSMPDADCRANDQICAL